MYSHKLFQPILTKKPSVGDDPLSLKEFLDLLKPEEDYFPDEQNRTKLMITRIRKIFYDKWGWDTQVIRGAKDIECRYEMKLLPQNEVKVAEGSKKKKVVKKDLKFQPPQQVFVAVYRPTDKVYPERAGQVPVIYADNHQEVLLPEDYICDVGHILSGVDAYSYFAPLSPLPNWLMWAHKLFPYCDSNLDFATWLGDVASAAGEFLFEELDHPNWKRSDEQDEIDKYNPGSDMLGNIDAYAIAQMFDTRAKEGKRFSEMLEEFYFTENEGRSHRFSNFCKWLGLEGWDGENFTNERKWIKHYKQQLRDATAFYVYGRMSNLKGMWLALKVWLRFYEKELDLELLLEILLKSVKDEIKKEPKPKSQKADIIQEPQPPVS